MSMYSDAVAAVRNVVDTQQQRRDAAAAERRAENIAAQRTAILGWEPEDSSYRAVVELLAHTMTIGREDGYPAVTIPEDTSAVLRAACESGMSRHGMHNDFSGFGLGPDSDAMESDVDAAMVAKRYRDKQCVDTL